MQPRRYAALLGILAAVVLGRSFVAEPYLLAGRSMYPTFLPNDYVLVEKLGGRLFGYRRGDVVVFREPSTPVAGLKRIVGLPGDSVCVSDDGLVVTRGTAVVWRRAAEPRTPAPDGCRPLSLGDDQYFVLGDHWLASVDSRVFGPVAGAHIVGRAALRLFPPVRSWKRPAPLAAVALILLGAAVVRWRVARRAALASALAAAVLLATPARAAEPEPSNLLGMYDAIASGLATRDPDAGLLLGRLLELAGDARLATWARIGRGADRLLDGDIGGAAAEWQRAADTDPGTPWGADAALALGLGRIMQGDRAAAVAALRDASASGEPDVVPYADVLLGRVEAADGDPGAAELSFRRVLDEFPAAGVADDAALGLARSLVAEGRSADARGVLALAERRYEDRRAPDGSERPLEPERLGRLRPARLAALLAAYADRARERGTPPLEALLRALVDRQSGRELRHLRRRLAATGASGAPPPVAALPVIAPAPGDGGPPSAIPRPARPAPPARAGRRAGALALATVALALLAGAAIRRVRNFRRATVNRPALL